MPSLDRGASRHARVSSPAPRSTTCHSLGAARPSPPPSMASSTASSKKRVRMAMRPLSPPRERTPATASGPASAAANGSSKSGRRASSSSARSAAMDLELSDTATGSSRAEWSSRASSRSRPSRRAALRDDILSTASSRDAFPPSRPASSAALPEAPRRRPRLPPALERRPLSGLSPPRPRLSARRTLPPSCLTLGHARCAR
mmetsp:Transcript_2790/g.10958  ORF Transcript_2790/g.10958 Transcript_2790/m.10958 type:complete len:202 (+) Transcript_2790:681-1286(+)